MGNDVVNESKDCCKEEAQKEDSGCCFLSIMESAGRGISNGVSSAYRGAEAVGSAAIQGAASGVGIAIGKETSDLIARGAIAGGAVLALDQAVKHPAAAAAVIGAGAVGAAISEALKDQGKDNKAGCAVDCATDMVIGAAIGGAVGAATGDLTRAATLAAMGAITGCAARCAAEMCKPGCCVKPSDPISVAKDLGKAVLDHVQNRPIEAVAEAVAAGAVGVAGGALAHKIMEKDCCGNVVEKALKGAAKEIQRQAEMLKNLFQPQLLPLMDAGAGRAVQAGVEAAVVGAAVGAAGVGAGKMAAGAIEAAKAGAKAVQAGEQSELDKHRKDNPTTSQVERVAGQIIGGPIAGKAVGTAIEYGDAKSRQAYKWVKSFFE